MVTKKVRLEADIAPDVAQALIDLAEGKGISLSEAIRRAISTEYYLFKKMNEGAEVLIEENGVRTKIIPT